VRYCEGAGLLLRHENNTTTVAQIEEERERVAGEPSGLVPLDQLGSDELGPAAHDVRLNLTVVTGSFDTTGELGTTFINRLAPRVPVIVVDGDQPIPA
jgi:hypothetical protein